MFRCDLHIPPSEKNLLLLTQNHLFLPLFSTKYTSVFNTYLLYVSVCFTHTIFREKSLITYTKPPVSSSFFNQMHSYINFQKVSGLMVASVYGLHFPNNNYASDSYQLL
jgi:hypothetical protein